MKPVVIENPIIHSPFDELLKKTGAGNLFMVFGEPGVEIRPAVEGRAPRVPDQKEKSGKESGTRETRPSNQPVAEIDGVNIYDPTTGQASSPSPRDAGVGRGRGRGAPDDSLNLILECTGQKKKDKEAKVTTAQTLWIPAVNSHGEFGRWAFLEIRDPRDAQREIRATLNHRGLGVVAQA